MLEANSQHIKDSPQPPLLNVHQVAAYLSVSVWSVQRWAKAGQIPHFRLPGGGLRFEFEMLEAFLEPDSLGK